LRVTAYRIENDYNVVPHLTRLRNLQLLNSNMFASTSLDRLTDLTTLKFVSSDSFSSCTPFPNIVDAGQLKCLSLSNCMDIPVSGIPTSVTDLELIFPQHRNAITSSLLLHELPVLRDLRSLRIDETTLPTAFMTWTLRHLTQLTNLHLFDVHFVSTKCPPVFTATMPHLKHLYHRARSDLPDKGEASTNALITCLHMPNLQYLHLASPLSFEAYCLLQKNRVHVDCMCIAPLHIFMNDNQYITACTVFSNESIRQWVGNSHFVDMSTVTDSGVRLAIAMMGESMYTVDVIPPNTGEDHSTLLRMLPLVTDHSLDAIAEACPNLTSLRIASGVMDIAFTRMGFQSFASSMESLVELELWNCYGLIDSDVRTLVSRNTRLKTLLLSGLEEVGLSGYSSLGKLTDL
jgi:hypothetical protein